MKHINKKIIYILMATLTILAFYMKGGTSVLPEGMLDKIPDNFIVKAMLHFKYSVKEFDFPALILGAVLYKVYEYLLNREYKRRVGLLIVSFIASFIFLLCESYYYTNSWDMLFESSSAIMVACIRGLGYGILIYVFLTYISEQQLDLGGRYKINSGTKKWHRIAIWSGIILICWIPYFIMLFPGCFSPDAQDEIAQLYNNRDYCWSIKGMVLQDESIILNNHHPVFFTMILKAVLVAGRVLNSYEWVFELFCIFQCVVLAVVFAYSINTMYENGVKTWYRNITLVFFAFNPVFPIYGMTVVKDTLFMACFMLSVTLLYEIIVSKKWDLTKALITSAVFFIMMLLRNNGIYILFILGVFVLVLFRKNKYALKRLGMMILIPILVFQVGVNGILFPALDITQGSIREILSVPFQQTARYIDEYEDEVTDEEAEAICAILNEGGTIDEIAERYVPDRADNVKNKYNKYSTGEDLVSYFKVWCKQLIKHPAVYVESFLNMNYGWFSYYSNQDHSTYAGAGDLNLPEIVQGFDNPGGNTKIRNMVYEWVRAWEKIPVISWTVEFSSYTWGYLLLLVIMIIKKKWKGLLISMGIYVNYLICFLGPVAYLRYALPMMICFPLIIYVVFSDRIDCENWLISKCNKKVE